MYGCFLNVSKVSRMSKDFKMVESIGSQHYYVNTSALNKVCVFVKVNSKCSYIISVPNLYHYN